MHIPYIANRSRWKSFVVVEINCNSLENIHGCMMIWYSQTLLHRLFHWKSFAVADQSMKTAKLFHLEQFAIYGMSEICLKHVYLSIYTLLITFR